MRAQMQLQHDWALLGLRFVWGFGFLFHGYPKLLAPEAHQGFADLLGSIGVPAPEVTAWAIGALELVGGLALVLGALTRMISALLAVEMVVALIAVHLPHGFSFMNVLEQTPHGPVFGMPGYEVNVLYLGGLLVFLLCGAGRFSIDDAVQQTRRRRRADSPRRLRELESSHAG